MRQPENRPVRNETAGALIERRPQVPAPGADFPVQPTLRTGAHTVPGVRRQTAEPLAMDR